MNYLTQHYKNRCEQLQEQITILSSHLNKLLEASATGVGGGIESAEAPGQAPTYDGAGLAQLLGSVGSSMTPANQSAIRAYLSAWNAQNMGGGGTPTPPPAALMTAPTTGKSVANVARDIMAGGAASETVKDEESTTPATPTGGGGGSIPGDYNGDGVVDGADLSLALGNFGREGYDVNKVLQNWTGRASSSEAVRGTINPRRRA